MIDASPIAAIFERFTSGYHFYLEDLRSGESVELGERAAWPIGSCFKLAVLIAYFEALADGSLPPDSLDSETRIPPERFSTGGGVVNLLDTPLSLTDRQMLRLMIAASDGTATDVLIEKLGLGRVQATLKRVAPDSTLACGLDEMVRRFRDIPGALDCKTRDWTADGARAFRDATARLGATNAVDLAALAAALPLFPGTMPSPVWPLASMFFKEKVIIEKSGSLGSGFFLVDCGLVLEDGVALAQFGFCTFGWLIPKRAVESVCGLIGLEMAKALGLAAKPNWDFTPEGAKLLLGDPWLG